ncbi:hypothetical protein DF18_10150 [Streptomyces rimosus]|nr:hypothetical protein DF18_10150 [Streptomyces rimosus]
MRNFQYGIFSTPESGPAKMRSRAMKRPKKTAHMPHLSNFSSAIATWSGPKCFGNFRPAQLTSG